MAELIGAQYKLNDDEAIGFLNASTGTAFNQEQFEVESIELVTGEDGEKVLLVVVGPKG